MTLRNRAALAALLLVAIAAPGIAVQHNTPGASGYDLVSYHTGEKPLPGNGNHVAVHDGVTYQFVNEANREAFEKDPERYLPAYGGYCAYGVAVGKKFSGDPNVWEIVDGRLYLNLDNKIKGLWVKDIPGNIRKAEANWPAIQDKAASAL